MTLLQFQGDFMRADLVKYITLIDQDEGEVQQEVRIGFIGDADTLLFGFDSKPVAMAAINLFVAQWRKALP